MRKRESGVTRVSRSGPRATRHAGGVGPPRGPYGHRHARDHSQVGEAGHAGPEREARSAGSGPRLSPGDGQRPPRSRYRPDTRGLAKETTGRRCGVSLCRYTRFNRRTRRSETMPTVTAPRARAGAIERSQAASPGDLVTPCVHDVDREPPRRTSSFRLARRTASPINHASLRAPPLVNASYALTICCTSL